MEYVFLRISILMHECSDDAYEIRVIVGNHNIGCQGTMTNYLSAFGR